MLENVLQDELELFNLKGRLNQILRKLSKKILQQETCGARLDREFECFASNFLNMNSNSSGSQFSVVRENEVEINFYLEQSNLYFYVLFEQNCSALKNCSQLHSPVW
ncbi:hypothetical protein BpHYR1_026384 [Brachionus plicatilis]|uniref:Uncharacterized protein n=1 Tax=Brachionus plicatilis TaxID=10195 RepID=A0A3M7SVA6_BRAPC|nr:hypothetical protein BpHYR1_026384 [Brachionus plicatilis]